jgi:hypothetical protein
MCLHSTPRAPFFEIRGEETQIPNIGNQIYRYYARQPDADPAFGIRWPPIKRQSLSENVIYAMAIAMLGR